MKLVFATGNDGKADEVRNALDGTGVTVDRRNVDIDEIDAHDVEDVARRKAKESADALDADQPVLVDDTGLYIKALNGFPGSHAAYSLDTIGIDGLLTLMDGIDDRKAYFKSTMAIHYPETGETVTLSGTCTGTIATEESGNDGFGYDTVFIPDGNDATFAADIGYKEQVSHRVEAIRKLVDHLSS
jgi:XTP/dITP diphosphohydrolase